ncbi:MAG: pyridoxal phosphate-dependent aminotransferase [Gammaproteobacteria bacterium]|nr:pyridoxal phosphate-dependent aminotransferase [Gammaproteobacteria bacterium]
MQISARTEAIEPFYVMEILARARELERAGKTIIHMEIGEPDFETPEPIVAAGVAALQSGRHHYTPALGLPELRQAIAEHYQHHYRTPLSADRVAVTPGSSGALQLLIALLVNPGDEVLMADPGYPCNRHFARLFEGEVVAIPVGPQNHFQLTTALVQQHWSERSRVVMISSPSNPSGTMIAKAELEGIAQFVAAEGGALIVDEIYHGLTYGGEEHTALDLPGEPFVVNSFSKYYGMTGWRLGWLVAPEAAMDGLDRLAQNLFLAPPTPSQYAALEALSVETAVILRQRRDEFMRRRDFLYQRLVALGFVLEERPEGAFYLYADCSHLSEDSSQFAMDLLEQAGVAITPGKDFSLSHPERWVRFAYTTSMEQLRVGVTRIAEFLGKGGRQ